MGTFENCNSLETVEVEQGVEIIGSCAFKFSINSTGLPYRQA